MSVFSDDKQALAVKAERVFPGLLIDKRRMPASQLQKRGIPAYVAEWLLDMVVPGLGEISPDELAKVSAYSERLIKTPRDQQIIRNELHEGNIVKTLTPVQVEVKIKGGKTSRSAKMSLLNLDDVEISSDIIDQNKDLLRQGMWGIVELQSSGSSIEILTFRPMQASVDVELFKQARREFSLEEWRRLILISMGYAPEAYSFDEQTLLLARLLPLVQKNAHMMELAPKATGKSYLFENISPRVRLVSGGNVSPAVLFVNNANGNWGLLARFSTVVLDEVQTLKFEKPEEIVGGLKGFLANGTLTRGGLHETSSDCSLVLLANIRLDDEQNPLSGPLVVQDLPRFLHETALLDRFRGIIPGWELRKLGPDCFANTVGLKADFFGDALLALRNDLSHDQLCNSRVQLAGARQYARNTQSVRSLASGMAKILFPHGEITDYELEEYCVKPAVRYRQIVWDQLYALDEEYRQYEEQLVGVLT